MLVPAEFGSLIKSYSVCFHCVLQSLGLLVSTEFWFHWLQRSLVPVLVSTEFGSMGSCGCLLHNFLQSFCVHWIQLNLVPILAPTEFGSAITFCRGLVPVISVVLKRLKLGLLAFMKWMQIDYADSACMTNSS